MNEWFGLGIALELRDRMSQGLETARNSFERFRNTTQQSVQDVESQIDRLNSLQITGALLSSTGGMLTGMGASLLNPVIDLGREVINTSSQFEQWRMTLKALYKDADVATEKLNWGMKLAATTPFEMTDVTQALIGFKAVGAEADTMFTNANGQARSFLEYMGDLAALRPDVGLQGVMLGVRNLLGGDGGKSLRMRMDIDFENILGRDFGSTTEEIMQDLVTVSDQLAGGLMTELEGTWSQLISNLKDQATRLYLAIGDNGAFDMFKNSLKGFSDIINDIDDDRMAKIGKNIAEAFKMIWTPVQWVINGLQTVFKWIIKLAESDSVFSKLVLGVTTFLGSILALTGVMLTLGGGFIQTIASLGVFLLMLQTAPLKFTGIINALKILASKILPLIAVMGALAVAWKTDFMGIRTTMTNFTNTLRTSWNEAKRISSLGVTDMLAELSKLDTTTFGGWLTYRLVQLRVLWEAVCEAWNTNELSDETFQKVQALGLLPLLSAILDMKQRVTSFFDGFKEGWRNVSKVVSSVVGFLGRLFGNIISWLFPVKEGVDEVSEAVGGINIKAWEKFGEVTAYVVSMLGGLWVVSKIIGLFSWIGGVLSSVGGLLSSVASGIGTLVGWVGSFLGAIGGIVTAILGAFGIAVTLPAWVVGAIVVAIGAIIGLIVAFWDEIVAGAKWCWEQVCDFFSKLGDWCVEVWNKICEGAKWLWDKIVEYAQPVITFFEGLGQLLLGIFQVVWSTISNLAIICWNTIKLVVGLVWEGIKSIISTAKDFIVGIWNSFVEVAQPIWEAISNFARECWDNIKEVWETVSTFFSELWNGILNNVILPVWNSIKDFISQAYNFVTELWNQASTFFSDLWNSILNNTIIPIWEGIKTAINNVFNFVTSLWNTITGFFSGIWNAVLGVVGEVWGGIKGVCQSAYDNVTEVWNGVVGAFQGVWDGIKQGASAMFEWLSAKFSWVADTVSAIQGAWSSIKDGVSSGWNNIKEGAKKMVGLNTGGYVKTEGIAMLHPNEVVVNDELTQQLRGFLSSPELTLAKGMEAQNKQDMNTLRTQEASPSIPTRQSVNSTVSNDNSVTFNEGAIQINLQQGTEADATKLAKMIMEKIKRETQLRSTLNYNAI